MILCTLVWLPFLLVCSLASGGAAISQFNQSKLRHILSSDSSVLDNTGGLCNDISVDYQLVSIGAGNFTSQFVVTNNYPAPVYTWQVVWQFPGSPISVDHVSGAVLLSMPGAQAAFPVRVVNNAYDQNSVLGANGGNGTFTFTASLPQNSTPGSTQSAAVVDVVVNGISCSPLPTGQQPASGTTGGGPSSSLPPSCFSFSQGDPPPPPDPSIPVWPAGAALAPTPAPDWGLPPEGLGPEGLGGGPGPDAGPAPAENPMAWDHLEAVKMAPAEAPVGGNAAEGPWPGSGALPDSPRPAPAMPGGICSMRFCCGQQVVVPLLWPPPSPAAGIPPSLPQQLGASPGASSSNILLSPQAQPAPAPAPSVEAFEGEPQPGPPLPPTATSQGSPAEAPLAALLPAPGPLDTPQPPTPPVTPLPPPLPPPSPLPAQDAAPSGKPPLSPAVLSTLAVLGSLTLAAGGAAFLFCWRRTRQAVPSPGKLPGKPGVTIERGTAVPPVPRSGSRRPLLTLPGLGELCPRCCGGGGFAESAAAMGGDVSPPPAAVHAGPPGPDDPFRWDPERRCEARGGPGGWGSEMGVRSAVTNRDLALPEAGSGTWEAFEGLDFADSRLQLAAELPRGPCPTPASSLTWEQSFSWAASSLQMQASQARVSGSSQPGRAPLSIEGESAAAVPWIAHVLQQHLGGHPLFSECPQPLSSAPLPGPGVSLQQMLGQQSQGQEGQTVSQVPNPFGAEEGMSALASSSEGSTSVSMDINLATEVELEERIGSGAFGSVFRGKWKGREVAVKIMHASLHGGSSELDTFRQEVKVLSALQHERIIPLLGACMVAPHICIVEELAKGGSLYDKLHLDGKGAKGCYPLEHSELLLVAIDVAEAMAYLHPSIVHRDLKPQNVLLGLDGRAKVCDFGIATFKHRTFISTRNCQAGTPAYMAPEMFEGHRVSEKVDIFSFGVLLWSCVTGQVPWSRLATPMQVIYVVGVLKERPKIPKTCAPAISSLIQSCWQAEPECRPDFPQILAILQKERMRIILPSLES